jgi:perosamine synthetase
MLTVKRTGLNVPFFRPSITEAEAEEVVACLRSGWLTTGGRAKEFEMRFADFVGAKYAVALNSCTAALHLAVEALGLKRGQAVLVPTMTFAATAEVVLRQGAVPVLVDCDPVTLNMDLDDAERKLLDLRNGRSPLSPALKVAGIIPVHVGGLMIDVKAIQSFAKRHRLWIVEDAAHAFPAACRNGSHQRWRRCGANTAAVTCYSFYANKTITTGEGGMAVTDSRELMERIRRMSLHGLSLDAWSRRTGNGAWDYRVLVPGYKYNMTDIAAAIGLCQLDRAETMRQGREAIAAYYRSALCDLEQLELPPAPANRMHAWHLFPVRLFLQALTIDRNAFINCLHGRGIGCSVHWRPLHLHRYYRKKFGWLPEHFPVASSVWKRLVSLPLFPDMRQEEQEYVADVIRQLCAEYRQGDRKGGVALNERPRIEVTAPVL